MHLIIPYAAWAGVPQDALKSLDLPHLRQWLGQAQCIHRDDDGEQPAPHMPHERAQARALGWPMPGPLPWAALAHPHNTAPQAWVTPCHWQIGMDQVVMLEPSVLKLSDEESRQLLQAMQVFLKEDGLDVAWHSACLWHASGEIFKNLQTASLDRVIGANAKSWITDGHLPTSLRRLQSEMQMLLYNHPVNDARMAQGQFTVNSFWVHGAGALTADHAVHANTQVQVLDDLRAPAMQGDWRAWQAAWQRIDTEQLAPHLASKTPHPDLQLSLCSERAAHTYQRTNASWLARIGAALRRPDTSLALQALIAP